MGASSISGREWGRVLYMRRRPEAEAAIRQMLPLIYKLGRRSHFDSMDDAVQSGALHLLEQLPKYDPQQSKFSTWSTVVLRRFFGRRARINTKYRHRFPNSDRLDIEGEDTPETLFELAHCHRRVSALIAELNARSRFVICERYWHEQSLRATGAALGLSGEGTRQIERRALNKLGTQITLDPCLMEACI